MAIDSRRPGWDAQAIRDVADRLYGGFAEMFEAHNWAERGAAMMPAQGKRVAETYGSTEAFLKAHRDGRDMNPVLDPMAAIQSDPPQVFLKSFHGFTPESWGFLGYTKPTSREKYLRESRPGALVVICGTSKAEKPEERLRVLGMQQQSHVLGAKWDWLAPERHEDERNDPDRAGRWRYAVKAMRAWRIPEQERPFVRDIFPQTHKGGDNGTAIGSYGLRLQPEEAHAILGLNLVEVPVFAGQTLLDGLTRTARASLKPSRPGPVSQTGHWANEAEGPKHLYILHLTGDADALLGYPSNGAKIVKVGFSHSPDTRRDAHNGALPACAFTWQVDFSTLADGRDPFPSSAHALAGEQAMKDLLEVEGKSLGGEFFIADISAIDRAWKAAIDAAENWKP